MATLIGLSMFLWVPLFAQIEQLDGRVGVDNIKKQNLYNIKENNDSLILLKLGKTRIILKDGCILKNCIVKEIHEYWIVYEKEGSLHDLLIDQIRRIEIGKESLQAFFFDEKNKPVIRRIN